MYASQTKILENETAGRACLFEVLCEGVSTRFGLRMFAKSLEKTRPTGCFVFQNLRLGSINLLVIFIASACGLLVIPTETLAFVVIEVSYLRFHATFMLPKRRFGKEQPSATSPLFWTISILDKSPKVSTWISGCHCANSKPVCHCWKIPFRESLLYRRHIDRQ